MLRKINGKKTYGAAASAVAYALVSALTGEMSWHEAVGWFVASGGLASVRHAIEKLQAR